MGSMETTIGHESLPALLTTVRVAGDGDLSEVLRVQHVAFERVATRHGLARDDMAPLTERLDDLQALAADGVRTFVATVASRSSRDRDAAAGPIVGTVRATVRDDGVVEIGRLAVDEGFERRGVATALMRSLEDAYPEAQRFELYTGAEADDALALYDRSGYREFRRERFRTWTRVWLAKDRAPATAPADAPLH
jgi:ribosomal protein S18 acetylase RimI-like enzyme